MRGEAFRLGLAEAAEKISAGELTPLDYTDSCLARIRELEPLVEAWAWMDEDWARGGAEAATPGPLRGMPVGIKDIIDVAGLPCERGSPAYEGRRPEESAELVNRLEAAGAFVMGKTVTAELAYYTPGKTRNPWNPAHTPGGSSSGSAAAVAAGMVPAAVGTQTNGSVIRPAAFCGVVGYKPTQGLIPLSGVMEFSRSLDQAGVFARSVADAALVAGVLSKGRIPMTVADLEAPPRLLALRTPVWERAEHPMRAHFAWYLDRLRESGAQVDEPQDKVEDQASPVFSGAHGILRTIMYYEGARALARLRRDKGRHLSAALVRLIDEGLQLGPEDLANAFVARGTVQEELARRLQAYDAIVALSAPGEAPATREETGDPAFCTLWTLTGAPAVNVPSGFGPTGLPMGVQVVGGRGEDEKTLRVARWIERRLPITHLYEVM